MNKNQTTVSTDFLILKNVRMPRGIENETGAQVVFEYQCEETKERLNVYGRKNEEKELDQWADRDGDNIPESEANLLLQNSAALKAWAEHGWSYVKRYCM
jgi:hypothetical protein